MAVSWLRRQWHEVISVWRMAPVCFSLGGAFGGALILSVGLFICCGSSVLYYLVDPVVEYFHPGVDAPDSWALGITYLSYFVMGLSIGSIVFLVPGLWKAYSKIRRDVGAAPAQE